MVSLNKPLIEHLKMCFIFDKMVKLFQLMKTLLKLLSFSALLLILSCHNNTKVSIIERWDNGKNKLVYTYSSPRDTLSYLYESFYRSGKPEGKGQIVSGKMDGTWLWLFENGNKKDEATLIQGAYTGERKHWSENGTLSKVEILSKKCFDECCDGKLIFYYPSGKKRIEYSNF